MRTENGLQKVVIQVRKLFSGVITGINLLRIIVSVTGNYGDSSAAAE